jgi:hypothetical protein
VWKCASLLIQHIQAHDRAVGKREKQRDAEANKQA